MPPSAEQANRRYFRRAYQTGEHGWDTVEPSPDAVRWLRRARDEFGARTLLDVGCGEGRNTIAAAKLGYRVTAVDFEPLAIARARQFARSARASGIRFRVGDVRRLPLASSAFDVVLDYGCLHHQRKADWPAYRRNVLRVLKGGGLYILSVFSPRFRMFRPGGRKWHVAAGAYRRCFTRDDLLALLDGDFDVLEMRELRGDDGGFWHVLAKRARAE